MAATSSFSVGDVVLVPFPFTDQSDTKKRPAVVVSSAGYNANRRDIVILAITSQVRQALAFGDAMVADWQAAGLIKASVLKPVFTTIEQRLVIRGIGTLSGSGARSRGLSGSSARPGRRTKSALGQRAASRRLGPQ